MDIQLNLEQKQLLSQRMIQSAQILQMSSQELKEYLDKLTLENPVIDIKEQTPDELKKEEKLRKYEWLNSLDEQNRYTYQQEESESEKSGEDYIFRSNDSETLKDYLWSQLVTFDFTKKERAMIEFMLENVNSRGYMTEDVCVVAEQFQADPEQALRLLHILQSLEPAGICARTLSECLLLQAKRFSLLTPEMEVILLQHLELIGSNKLPEIAKKTKLPLKKVAACCQQIKKLNPSPGNAFSSREQLSYIVPDVTLVKFKDRFEILLNEYLYPDIQINSYYKQLSKTSLEPETTEYLQTKLSQAQWIRECISKRRTTLLNVSKTIFEAQIDFFYHGPSHLKPLRLTDAAEKLEIHESTVSRAVRGKYLQCLWGIFPMSYFFSKGLAGKNNEADYSASQIKQLLADIIKSENKKMPLSDRVLSEELEKKGVILSRRTVAKYRQALKIPDASGRKIY